MVGLHLLHDPTGRPLPAPMIQDFAGAIQTANARHVDWSPHPCLWLRHVYHPAPDQAAAGPPPEPAPGQTVFHGDVYNGPDLLSRLGRAALPPSAPGRRPAAVVGFFPSGPLGETGAWVRGAHVPPPATIGRVRPDGLCAR